MSLSVVKIKSAKSDQELFELLSGELQRRLPKSVHENREELCRAIRNLPRGLRAMAATHRLDISMAIDDLGWHFANFYHRGLNDETEQGLREIGATEVADIFQHARTQFEEHWQNVGQTSEQSLKDFERWYKSSGLEASLEPSNKRLWKICSEYPDYGLMHYWLDYARKHPENLIDQP